MKWWVIYLNLPVNSIDIPFRLCHPRSGDSQSQETFLAPSADKQTHNYDKECSNHRLSLSTLKPKRLSRSNMKWSAVYINLPSNAIFRLLHPRSGDNQGQETFLAPSAGKQTLNYDKECRNHRPCLSTLRPKGLSCSKVKWRAIYANLPVNGKYRCLYMKMWN